jgi:hypothetical protein
MRRHTQCYDDPMDAGLLAAGILGGPDAAVLGLPTEPAVSPGRWFYESFGSNLGTGGRITGLSQCDEGLTSVHVIVICPRRPERAAALHDTPSRITSIRSALSLNVKELASVLQVERPTVYAWMAGEAQPQPRNLARIDALWTIAREWEALCPLPLGALRTAVNQEGASIVGLLGASDIDSGLVTALLRKAATLVASAERRPRGLDLRARAAARGVTLVEPPDAQREIDLRTGKRISDE